MSAPHDLKDLYTGELQDLWSANDQMAKIVKKMAGKASDSALKDMLAKSQDGIAQHTSMLKELRIPAGEKVKKDHCNGMEGLVAEATKHMQDEAPEKGAVMDAVIIAQYQRMSQYGIAGFGTAASFAGTLGLKSAAKTLDTATRQIYRSDEYLTKLAEMAVNIEARA
jgi:ferritin-like metal-binding protein YciE